MKTRSRMAEFETRTREDGAKVIRCYFVVFGAVYQIAPDLTETVAPGAFDLERDNDVRALTDHVSHLVLGRTTAGTLKLGVDDKGLWGEITINEDDQDALNLYARVQRGDVSQCSFGFDILDEERLTPVDGVIQFIIRGVELYEVSIVTFPAYEETSAQVRNADAADMADRLESWKADMRGKLRAK